MQLFKWADFEADICKIRKNARVRAWLGGDDVQALAKVQEDLSFLEGPSGGEAGGEAGGEEGGEAGEEGDRSNLGEDGEGGEVGDTGEGETGGDDELPEPEDLLAGVGDLDIDTEELIATGFAGIVVVREQNEGKSQEEQLEELKEVIKFLNEDEDYNNQGGITEEEVNILRVGPQIVVLIWMIWVLYYPSYRIRIIRKKKYKTYRH